jgi:hypothetical protein
MNRRNNTPSRPLSLLPVNTSLIECEQPVADTTMTFDPTSAQKSFSAAEVHEPTRDTPTPVSCSSSSLDDGTDQQPIVSNGPSSPEPHTQYPPRRRLTESIVWDPFRRLRFLPNSTSSYLKPGSRFAGLQRSDKMEYEVSVEIQHVDTDESFMCGYLTIRGLAEEHPFLTTFFEGEMIGSQYGFITNHPDWGANEKVDFQHWARFPAWRPLQKDARSRNFSLNNWPQKEHIWMRWKEHFLVPDHKVKDLHNASFDGFYYICFNQVDGSIQGTYYHAKSDK